MSKTIEKPDAEAVDLDRPFGPFEVVKFENGMEVTLLDDGNLRVLASGRGLNSITIHPSSDNCCRISPVGKLYSPNK